MSVAHSASVSGDVTAGTTASIAGTVGGTVTQHSRIRALSGATLAACSPYSAESGTTGGKFTYSPSTGDLTVKAGIVKLAKGSYCFNDIALARGATLSVRSRVAIYLTGKLSGHGHISNSTHLPDILHLYSSFTGSGGVTIVGGSQAAMTIKAPGTTVTITGGSFFGTLLGKMVNLTGGVAFHADMR